MTSASLLIDCWESAGRAPEPWRALALLQSVHGGPDLATLAQLPVGKRDAALLELRRSILGDTVEALARCPSCGSAVEVDFRVSEILIPPGSEQKMRVEAEGWGLDFRLPNSFDLVAASTSHDAGAARQVLLERCVTRVTHDEKQVPFADAPAGVIESMEASMAASDPQADVVFRLTCDACGAGWDADVEADSLVRTELSAAAARLLGEIHALAAAYGWSENEIIDLSPARRQAYLDLVGGV